MSGVYPITDNLKDEIPSELHDHPAIAAIIETVGEYEHGTADVGDVSSADPVTMKQYAAVALDLAMVIGEAVYKPGAPNPARTERCFTIRDGLVQALVGRTSVMGALLTQMPDEFLDSLEQWIKNHEEIMARK